MEENRVVYLSFDNSNQKDETGDEILMPVIDVSIDYDEGIQEIEDVYYVTECYEIAEENGSSLINEAEDSENNSLVLQEKDIPNEKEYTIEKEKSLCNVHPQVLQEKDIPNEKEYTIEKEKSLCNVHPQVLQEKDIPNEKGYTLEKEKSLCNLHPQVILRKLNASDMLENVKENLTATPPQDGNNSSYEENSREQNHQGFSNESSSTEHLQMKPKKRRQKKSKEPIRLDHWNIRRSERIQMMLIQKECNLAASAVTSKPTLENTNTSQQKRRASSKGKQKSVKTGAQSNLLRPTTLSSNAVPYVKVPERVEGFINRGGTEYVIVKWKDQKYSEHISTKNLSDDLKRLVVSYLHSRLFFLTPNKNATQEREDHVSLVRENSLCQEREESMLRCQEREDPMLRVSEDPVNQESEEDVSIVREDPVCQEREERLFPEIEKDYCPAPQAEFHVTLNCTVQNNIQAQLPSLHVQKINISHYKSQQKLYIEESGLFDRENACAMDVKLSV